MNEAARSLESGCWNRNVYQRLMTIAREPGVMSQGSAAGDK